MIPEKDAINFSLAPIERAFRKKGHIVDIYGLYCADNVLRMFDEEVVKKSVDELTIEIMNEYDLIFASVFSMGKLRELKLLSVKKYIFTYDFFIHGEIVNGGDFNFAPSLNNTVSAYKNIMSFTKMGIGEPKFDSLVYEENIESKRLLFIDSGHYPFGEKGKKKLARLLLSICERYPEYELCIKPRFLPADEVVTHNNALHLYDVIEEMSLGDIPSNMNMLREHIELEELINQSKTVLCMYTTAYISALVANKGLVIIDGLPNDDIYDIRHKRFIQTREGMKGSKALVHYTNVLQYLPEGIQSPKSHVQHELSLIGNVAEKIVEVTEFIYYEFIKKGSFPNKDWYEYEDYKQNITTRNDATWDTIISDRFENTLKYSCVTEIDYRINARINIEGLLEFIEGLKEDQLITEEVFINAYSNAREIIQNILIENYKVMEEDDIDFGILLEAYYHQKRYDLIKSVRKSNIGAYRYFRGRVALEERDMSMAKTLFEEYVETSLCRAFTKEKSDLPHYRSYVLHALSKMYIDEHNLIKAGYYIDLLKKQALNDQQAGNKLLLALSREQAYNELTIKWLNAVSQGKIDRIIDKLIEDRIMVYGAGTITENLVVNTKPLMNKVKVLIDQNSDSETKFGIPLIIPEQIVNYTDIRTIVVTVPHAYASIRENLLNIRADLNVISITELIDSL